LTFRSSPREGGGRRDFWHNVQSTGDTIKDQKLGSQLAYLTLQLIKSDNFAPLLGWVVLGMIEKQAPLISSSVFARQSPMCASVIIKSPLRT
jgi:hypothetical protein